MRCVEPGVSGRTLAPLPKPGDVQNGWMERRRDVFNHKLRTVPEDEEDQLSQDA